MSKFIINRLYPALRKLGLIPNGDINSEKNSKFDAIPADRGAGFTLIELLVVIVIISVLAGLLMVNFVGVRQRGRDAERKSEMRQIQAALEIYRTDNGNYPVTTDYPACNTPFTDSGGTVTYMRNTPCDPLDGSAYVYAATPSGCDNSATTCINYTIYGCLENANDSEADSTAQGSCTTSFTLANP